METQIFHHAEENIIFKKTSKRNQNPSRYHNSITILKSQHKPNYHLSKILNKNIPFTYGPKSLKLLYSIWNLNTISLPWKARPTNQCWPVIEKMVTRYTYLSIYPTRLNENLNLNCTSLYFLSTSSKIQQL
jgi:hypothetical protein